MVRTAQLDLPLVLPAQAQKHVTVNEALCRLDAVAQLRVLSSTIQNPPEAAEGASFLVPAGAVDVWAGKAGQIAVRSNGGWVFLLPRVGWRVWDESRDGASMFDGTGWIADALAVSKGGAGTLWRVVEFDHVFTAGGSNLTLVEIPSHAQVVGVSGRVVAEITGPGLTGWRIGTTGADNRYGSGLGLSRNSELVGMSGSPVTYYASTPLLVSAEGGAFASGAVRLALHLVCLDPPRAV
jgi:hypothetical protein